MNQELAYFIRESLEKGLSKTEIQQALRASGWREDETKTVLDLYSDTPFPVPVPRRRPYLSAREAFLYLLTFLTLYISAFSLGTMLFQFINRAYPDVAIQPYDLNQSTFDAIRSSTAALLISYPIFLGLSVFISRALKQDSEKRSSKIRKWLTYITLFVAAGVIIGDLITLVYNLLGGELTIRFGLKVLVVGVISGFIFGYYLWDLRNEEHV